MTSEALLGPGDARRRRSRGATASRSAGASTSPTPRRSPSGCRRPGRCSTSRPTATASRSASARRCCAARPACCRRTTRRTRSRGCARVSPAPMRWSKPSGDGDGLPTHRPRALARPSARPRRPIPRLDRRSRRRPRADLGLDRRAAAACQALGPAGRATPRAEARAPGRSDRPRSTRRPDAGRDGAGAAHVRLRVERAARAARRRRVRRRAAVLSRPTSPPRSPRAPRPRVLVTTPFHLKTLLESGVALPAVDLIVCATAPLSPQLARAPKRRFGGAADRDLRLHRSRPGRDAAHDRRRRVADLRRPDARRRRRAQPS